MNILSLVLGLLYIFAGAIIAVLSVPLITSKIKPNALYGIRLGESFTSEENWYKMNIYGGKVMIAAGAAVAASGLAILFINLENSILLILFFSFFPLVPIIVACILIINYSSKLD